jgi:hypothetical protein
MFPEPIFPHPHYGLLRQVVALVLWCAPLGLLNAQAAVRAKVRVGPNIHVSGKGPHDTRNESSIAVSPVAPNFFIATAQAYGTDSVNLGVQKCATAISRDGANTWRDVTLPGPPECFDPMTVPGPDGWMYVLYADLRWSKEPDAVGHGYVRVWGTKDQGKTWVGPGVIKAPIPPDHPRMVVDQTKGPRRGRIYVAWNEVSATLFKNQYHLFLHYSDDNGKTFTEPKLIVNDSMGKLVITEPIVLTDGTLLVTYYQYFQPFSSPKGEHWPMFILRSTDGGKTFAPPERIGEVGGAIQRRYRREWGQAFTLPILAADISPRSRYRDRIYMVWDDVSSGQSTIWMRYSSDGGRTWTQRKVSDAPAPPPGTPADRRSVPAVAVNDDGVVAVSWYDRREDPARQCWKTYFSASLDGGDTWLPNTAVSRVASCPPKETAPVIRIRNVATIPDDSLPSDSAFEAMSEAEKRQKYWMENEIWIRRAEREAGVMNRSSIDVSFDTGRDPFIGHYKGLTADSSGTFFPLWADRRNNSLQLYTAAVKVTADPDPVPPPTRESTLNDAVQVIAGKPTYDAAAGTTSFDVFLRNVSQRTIYGPVYLRVKSIGSGPNGPSAVIANADRNGTGVGAMWDFTKRLGDGGRLTPRMVSEAKRVVIKTRRETGLDTSLEFEVVGQVER